MIRFGRLMCTLGLVAAATGLAGAQERGPMIGRLASDGVTVGWSTTRPESGALHYGETEKCDRFITAQGAARRHEVRVTGLEPATRYYYRVSIGGNQGGRTWSFVTPATGTARVRIALFGDSGSGGARQSAVARALTAAKPDVLLHGGDLVYGTGEDKDYPARFWRPYRTLVATTPFYGCLGNHDVVTERGQPFFDNLVLPKNDKGHERWYAFTRGGSRFIVLDSNEFNGRWVTSGQRDWLKAQLARKTWPGWTVVLFHHPLYTAIDARIGGTLARRLVVAPLLEAGQVDLVLSGHDHYYHRTHPVSVTGKWTMVHVTSGAGGASLYPGKPRKWTAGYKSAYHFVWIDLESSATAKIEAQLVDGKTGETRVFDPVKLTRTKEGTRQW